MRAVTIKGYNFCRKHNREIDYELKLNICTKPCYKNGRWCEHYGYREVVEVEEGDASNLRRW